MSINESKTSMQSIKDNNHHRAEVLAVGGAVEMETGHKQELRVSMGLWSLLALSFANIAPTVAINGSLSVSLTSGGPVAVIWGWVIVALICLCVSASLAEMCSAWPHAAGQAYWAYMLSPPKWAPVLSYTTAFWNIAGGWALIAAGAYIFASGLLGIAVAFNPDYVQQRWQLFVLYIGLLFLFFLCNLFIVRLLDACTKGFALINILSVFATIVALAACAPIKQAPSFVFGTFVNETGWESSGLTFLLGLLQSAFTIIGFEASAHLCEEAHDAGRLAPLAIFGGTAIVGVVGFLWIITLLFCMGDFDSVLGTPTGVPVLQIFTDAFGRTGATVAFLVNILLLAFAVVGIICASSRAVWSMARDGGFPGSRWFGKVHPGLQVPIAACALQVTVPAILGLIYLGSPNLFLSAFQLTTIGYMLSYFIPIALLFFRGRQHLPTAVWRMPDWLGNVCAVVSLLYIPFITVLFFIPNYAPVDASNMNYTSPIFGVLILMMVGGWYAECRRSFKGPAAVAHGIEEEGTA